ncbi:helix-turn-helix domain-containing protein [Aeoliella mucimassa]|uniref:helix-turn-helix domain-containing protein n=1 Tax=Aeoliella mucimassa TaxID=2527972 RepID=UPI0011A0ED46|nr:helix-turn-helix transcriptional regulator [Aeoliella mucimassa]
MVDKDVKVLFGEQMRRIRSERGWSQEYLADEAALDRSYVGCIERGERNVSIENICKLADALGVSPAAFFDWWSAP